MKDNIPWVPHDTDMGEHPKCESLIATHGFEGYGRFLRLNELIGGAEGCTLDLSRKLYFNGVAKKLHMTPAELQEFIDFLADPDECGLVNNDNGVLTTDRTQEALEKVRKAREDGRVRQRRRRKSEQDQDNAEQTDSNVEVTRDEGTEQSRAEQNRSCSTAGADFQQWLHSYVSRRKDINRPSQFVRSVLKEPGKYDDLVAQFEADKTRASPGQRPRAPDHCDSCDSELVEVEGATAECQDCKRMWVLTRGRWSPIKGTGKVNGAHHPVASSV